MWARRNSRKRRSSNTLTGWFHWSPIWRCIGWFSRTFKAASEAQVSGTPEPTTSMGFLYDPLQPTSYIMDVDANNLYGWAISQKMPDCDFNWLSQDECRDLRQLLNYADDRIAIFDTGLFDIRKNKDDKKKFSSGGGLGVPAKATQARRRRLTNSGNNDYWTWNHRWKATQSARLVLWRRVPLQPKIDLVVFSDKALRRVRSTATLLSRSRNKAG